MGTTPRAGAATWTSCCPRRRSCAGCGTWQPCRTPRCRPSWPELQERPEIAAKALEFTILTAARTAETLGAQWSEIDFEARLWMVPAERIKGGREHRVPLSDRAVVILQSLPRELGNPRVFLSARQGKPLAEVAMLRVLRDLGIPCTVHGFRSTFRDWCAEQTNFPRELAEAALAHAPRDRTEAAYQRGDLLEKRRRLMRAWSGYCASPARATARLFRSHSSGKFHHGAARVCSPNAGSLRPAAAPVFSSESVSESTRCMVMVQSLMVQSLISALYLMKSAAT